ncbi:hypothetical protein [Lysinibacillus antri]|uniref:Uncharacterized protein n=1 Tax=Lysinibacillus antri TaxID=2498145 RepID=A0A3S0R7X1_9BACI|nr:hypothetical protein [Lysinibacillus antri]RUL55588.1 hypothetical protein EK386_04490 [Lysinibacillus antri]
MRRCKTCHNRKCTCHKLNDASHHISNNQPPIKPVDLFGSPFNCKKQKKTPRFTSPNSPLSADELNELQACIEEVNDLLRSLGSESNPNNTRQLQLHFFNLRGEIVKAQILTTPVEDEGDTDEGEEEQERIDMDGSDCHGKILNKIGKLATAGRDFIQMNEVGSATFILYEHLLSVTRENKCEYDKAIVPEFHDASQEMRRELAFNFGEFVTKDTELLNLFFGIPLYLHLKKYLGKDVKVKVAEGCIFGTLIATNANKINLVNNTGEIEFSLKDIYYIEVINIK